MGDEALCCRRLIWPSIFVVFGESVWTRWTLGEERSEPDSERGGVAGGDRGKYLESSGSVRAKTDVVMSGAQAE